MPGVNLAFNMKGAKVHYITTALPELTLTAVAAAISDDTVVKGVSSIGEISAERSVESFNTLDSDFSTNLTGFADGGTWELGLTLIPTNTFHTAFIADVSEEERTFVIVKTIGEKVTYFAFNGIISNASISPPSLEGVVSLDVTVARSGRHVMLNKV